MKKNKIIYYGLSIGWILVVPFGIWRLYQQSLENISNGTTVFMMLFSAVMAVAFFIRARKINS